MTLLDGFRGFGLPCGLQRAGSIQRVRTTEHGEIRSSPGGRWITFTAEQSIEATRSGFHWEARLKTGPLQLLLVTDAYESGHGRASLKLGGIPLATAPAGAELDKGELQRYLGLIAYCPPALVRHSSLEWTCLESGVLRVIDRADPTRSSVDIEIDAAGRPTAVRAVRPRTVGKKTLPTQWCGRYEDFGEWHGLRVPTRVLAAWRLSEGEFVYYRAVTTSLDIV